jgi:hypothetical protein
MLRLATLLLVLVLISAGCSMNKLIANNMTASMADIRTAFFDEGSPQQGFYGGPALLKQLDGFIVSSPRNEKMLLQAAELNCGYAMTFLDRSDRVWAAHQYAKGRSYAMRGLAEVNEELAAALARGDEAELQKLLPEVDVEDELPLLFFTGLCWGGQLNATMDETLAADLGIIEMIFQTCVDKKPDFYYGAGYTFFGVLNAGRTEMLGGNLEKGREYFEQAMSMYEGKFLLTKLLYATSYAVNSQQPELFVRLLNEVATANFEDPPDMKLPNVVARRDARQLLERVGDFFPGYQGPSELEPDLEPFIEEDIDLDLD